MATDIFQRIQVGLDEKRQHVTEFLEAAGHKTKGVADGREALEELDRNDYEVALIDLLMPTVPGEEFIVTDDSTTLFSMFHPSLGLQMPSSSPPLSMESSSWYREERRRKRPCSGQRTFSYR